MNNKYNIIKRSFTKPNKSTDIDFPDRNYNVPLVGFSNYDQPIKIGDLIGVKLASLEDKEVEFEADIDADYGISEDWKPPVVNGKYRCIEEYLFRITEIIEGGKFRVKPVFIEDKVIAKEVYESIDRVVTVPLKMVTLRKYELLELVYVRKRIVCIGKNDVDGYKYFDIYKANKFVNKCGKEGKLDIITEEDLPYTDYKKTIFDLDDPKELKCLTKFLNSVSDNKDYNFGTMEQIIAHMDQLYKDTMAIIGDEINFKCKYIYHKHSCLCKSEIKHEITEIQYDEIFRVFGDDPGYLLVQTEYVSNWNGRILNEKIRSAIIEGNIVRIAIGSKDSDKIERVIYFTILHKINENRFLAAIYNIYLSVYEDIVVVIDTRAITEVPTTWFVNENLIHFDDKTTNEGFFITGMNAAVKSTETYALNYDGLITISGCDYQEFAK